jgi:hypothetical protein
VPPLVRERGTPRPADVVTKVLCFFFALHAIACGMHWTGVLLLWICVAKRFAS